MPAGRPGRLWLVASWSSMSSQTAMIHWSPVLSRSGVGASLWSCGSKGITTPTRISRGFASRAMTRARLWAKSRILDCGNSILRQGRSWVWSFGRRAVGCPRSSCACFRRRRLRSRQPELPLDLSAAGSWLADVRPRRCCSSAFNKEQKVLGNAGGGTRTPDTRIMILVSPALIGSS
jgi:hypothetical protein